MAASDADSDADLLFGVDAVKPTPLLDMWQRPDGAGDPVGVVATTFALDPDFFERNCLARFLGVDSVDEGSGSVEELIAHLEFEEKLRAPLISLLVDRSAQSERGSLRWDLLPCSVPNGLLHSKVSVLLWENATRVIVSSANLTPSGYRFNLELALAADLGPSCLLPREVLLALVRELESYADLVPGLGGDAPAATRLNSLLELFRERAAAQEQTRGRLVAAAAPTNKRTQPLDLLDQVWKGAKPLEAVQLSPYWDTTDPAAIEAVSALLSGRPASARRHDVAVVVGPTGSISFPMREYGSKLKGKVAQLKQDDGNARALHAKCLIVSSPDTVAVLMGSSNHTKAGLGLGGPRRHCEFNIWLSAPRSSPEGKALVRLIELGQKVKADEITEALDDEDEPGDAVTLSPFFGLSTLTQRHGDWTLVLGLGLAKEPASWRVRLPSGPLLLDKASWADSGSPSSVVIPVEVEGLPTYLEAEWDGASAAWSVLVDDRQALPAAPALKDLRARQVLDALAAGKPIERALYEALLQAHQVSRSGPSGIETDPLKRFDSKSSLLRRGRALSRALSALEERLGRPVATLEGLEARLKGPLGPTFLAARVRDDVESGQMPQSEGVFTLAEVALSIGRVQWNGVVELIDGAEGIALVHAVLDDLSDTIAVLGSEDASLTSYAKRAIQKARRCLS